MFIAFLFSLSFFVLIGLGTLFIIKIISLINLLKEQNRVITKLEENLYLQLRDFQFKSKSLGNLSEKLLKNKNSFLGELVPGILISILPFKKIKSLLLLYRFSQKIWK